MAVSCQDAYLAGVNAAQKQDLLNKQTAARLLGLHGGAYLAPSRKACLWNSFLDGYLSIRPNAKPNRGKPRKFTNIEIVNKAFQMGLDGIPWTWISFSEYVELHITQINKAYKSQKPAILRAYNYGINQSQKDVAGC
jgi:hypothetical protein